MIPEQTFAAIAPFVAIATVLYGMSGLGTGTANDLVATALQRERRLR